MKRLIATFILFMTSLINAQSNPPIHFLWINSYNEVELILDSPGSFNPEGMELLDSSHKKYSFEIKKRTDDSVILSLKENINVSKNYRIKTATQELYGYYSMGFVENAFHYHGPLGVELNSNKKEALFKLWSPSAEKVSLVISSAQTGNILFTQGLTRKPRGLWEVKVSGKGNLEGLLYQYKIQAFGKEFLALDPYAKSMAPFNPKLNDRIGFGVIISNPKNENYQPLLQHKDDASFIGMELHVRDATISPDSPAENHLKGTYLGLISALDSYKNLGVTHLQIQPLQNFYTVDEVKRDYQGPETPKAEINYNWGYDPHNYFTPEGWFSTNAKDPNARVYELQKMTYEIHKLGMGIILDVVYNHVYNGEAFEAAAPGQYLRRNRRGEVSGGTGAGASLESRSVMVRRLIIDSLKYWQEVYHIDGFRFDLLGFMDRKTMTEIRASLHPETILYGEAWVFTDIPHDEAVIKTDLPQSLNISAFNDTARDAYTGRNAGWGFVQGHFHDHLNVRSGIIGGVKGHPQSHLISQNPYDSFAEKPVESLNYLTIHDGFTLWDKLNLSVGGDRARRIQLAKNAYAMLLTSQGRAIFHQGCEAGRSKPLYSNDPNPERAHTSGAVQSENGIGHFHENSYASADATNAFSWKRGSEFGGLREYIQGLILLRKKLPGLHFNEAASIHRGLKFLDSESLGVIAFMIDNTLEKNSNVEKILVIHNAEEGAREICSEEINEARDWSVMVDCQAAGINPLITSPVKIEKGKVSLPGKCSSVIVKGHL